MIIQAKVLSTKLLENGHTELELKEICDIYGNPINFITPEQLGYIWQDGFDKSRDYAEKWQEKYIKENFDYEI